MSSPQTATAANGAYEGFFANAIKGTVLLLALSAGILYLTGALAESEARHVFGLNGLLAGGALRERYLANGFIILIGYLLGGVAPLICAVLLLIALYIALAPIGRLVRNKQAWFKTDSKNRSQASSPPDQFFLHCPFSSDLLSQV